MAVGNPFNNVIVWPLVIGKPVPTVEMPWKVPVAELTYNWLLKIAVARRLVGVVASCIVGPTVSSVVNRLPFCEVVNQMFDPFVLAALRMLPEASSDTVPVLTAAVALIRPITRLVVAGGSADGLVPPGALS